MTCEVILKTRESLRGSLQKPRARVRAMSKLGIAMAMLASCGCDEKIDMTIVGEVRDPENGCEPILVEYTYHITKPEVVPAVWLQDWCGIMGDDNRMTCFLNSNNPQKNSQLWLPKNDRHTNAESTHPDIGCWKDELEAWQNKYGGYPSGNAGAGSNEDWNYHPIFNNGE